MNRVERSPRQFSYSGLYFGTRTLHGVIAEFANRRLQAAIQRQTCTMPSYEGTGVFTAFAKLSSFEDREFHYAAVHYPLVVILPTKVMTHLPKVHNSFSQMYQQPTMLHKIS